MFFADLLFSFAHTNFLAGARSDLYVNALDSPIFDIFIVVKLR